MSERGFRRWLEGLEMPDLMRRLDVLSAIPEDKATPEGLKRTVRAFNPAPKVRRPCFVCGRHRAISQSHHLVEVGLVAKVLRAMCIYDWAPPIPAVSLCPNHHAYWHALKRRRKAEISEVGREISDAEWDRLVEIEERQNASRDSVWQEVRRKFLEREEAYRQSKHREGEKRGER